MEDYYNIGVNITLWVQNFGEWFVPLMSSLSFLGTVEFYLFIAPALYWCVSSSLGLRLGILLLISVGINNAVKVALHTPRPYWYDERVIAYSTDPYFGMPSGHSQNAVVFWGVIATWAKKTWVTVLAILLIILIGFSRIYLGVHFVRDVLFGWAIGIIIIVIYVLFEKPLIRWINRSSNLILALCALFVSLGLIALNLIAVYSLGDWQIPDSWIEIALANAPDGPPIGSNTLEGVITAAGVFFGMSIGALWIRSLGGFDAGGKFSKRAVRYIVGLIGVIFLYIGLSLVFPEGEDLIGNIFRYIRYSLIGFWIFGLAPYLFIRTKLANQLVRE